MTSPIGDKVIINAAITGALLGKQDSPFLPVSEDEIVACAREVFDAGAAVVHLHARGVDGSNSHEADDFVSLVKEIRSVCPGLVICVSLSGRFVADVDARAAGLAARPDLASLTLGSMNFATGPSVNAPDTIHDLSQRIYEVGARPELEIFEPGFAHMARVMVERGVLATPLYANIILGVLGASPLDLIGLGHIVALLPPGTVWSVGGLGRFQTDAVVMALAAGGHVRVGLEDNLHLDRGRRTLATNGQLVERVARIARDMGRDPATPSEARSILGLS